MQVIPDNHQVRDTTPPTRPRRTPKAPAKYSPSPQERRKRKSKAKSSPKTRTPDGTRVTPMLRFRGQTWGVPTIPTVPEIEASNNETDEENTEK